MEAKDGELENGRQFAYEEEFAHYDLCCHGNGRLLVIVTHPKCDFASFFPTKCDEVAIVCVHTNMMIGRQALVRLALLLILHGFMKN